MSLEDGGVEKFLVKTFSGNSRFSSNNDRNGIMMVMWSSSKSFIQRRQKSDFIMNADNRHLKSKFI
jgi:hypothetical protein